MGARRPTPTPLVQLSDDGTHFIVPVDIWNKVFRKNALHDVLEQVAMLSYTLHFGGLTEAQKDELEHELHLTLEPYRQALVVASVFNQGG